MAWSDAARRAAAEMRKMRRVVRTKGHANVNPSIKNILSSSQYRKSVAADLRAMRSGTMPLKASRIKDALASTKYRNEVGGTTTQSRRINAFLKQRHIGLR